MPGSRIHRIAGAGAVLWGLAGLQGLGAVPWPTGFLQPTHLGTAGLEAVLAEINAVAEPETGPALGQGPTLRAGDRGDAVIVLRARLAASREAPASAPPDATLFDGQLEAAVRAFQRRHGLESDGLVGPATRAELDQTPGDRQRQIARTIASRRELPDDLGRRFLLVNLPALQLEAFDSGRPALTLRVIVGKADRPTPTLHSAVVGLTAHPTWNVPSRIARQEISVRAAQDPDYLPRLGIDVFPAGVTAEPLDPSGVDWRAFQCGEVDLTLRQRPGPRNALGAISFPFPTPYDVRLHDTPERGLFERARRDLSHGCVRVDRAFDLAYWLMERAPEGSRRLLEEALSGALTESFSLPTPVPLYIVDWPVWVDAHGILQMRPEIYPGRPS